MVTRGAKVVAMVLVGGTVLTGFVLLAAGLVLAIWGLATLRGEGERANYGIYPLLAGIALIVASAYLFSLFFVSFV